MNEDDNNDLDVTQKEGQFSEAAQQAQNTTQTVRNTNSQIVKTLKNKIKKSENAKLKKILDATSKIMPKIIAFLPYIIIAILILIVIVGLLAFLVTMPGMLTGKLKEFARNISNYIEGLFVGESEAYVDTENILETTNYIKGMGYDLIGYGFIPANKTSKSISDLIDEGYSDDNSDGIYEKGGVAYSGNYTGADGYIYSGSTGLKVEGEGAGGYVDEYGISYKTSGDEGGAPGTFETSGEIVGFSSNTDVSLIRKYLMTDNRQYILRNFDGSGWDELAKNALIALMGGTSGGSMASVPKWSKGLISLWNSVSGIATDPYDAAEKGKIVIDSNSKTMTIKTGWGSNAITYSMDGWTGRYGLSLELLLSLHLATMAPDLVDTITRTFDTDIQVYLDSIGDGEDAKITGYFRTDSGEYITLEQLEQKAGNDGVINKEDAFAIMKDYGIKSKNYEEFECEYIPEHKVLYMNDGTSNESFEEATTNSNLYVQNTIGRAGVGLSGSELQEIEAMTSWDEIQYNADSKSYINKGKLEDIISYINSSISYVETNYSEFQTSDSITGYDNISDLERIVSFNDFKDISGDTALAEICKYKHSSDTNENGNIIVALLVKRTSVDGNWDIGVIVYQEVSPKDIDSASGEVCSDHFEDGKISKVCGKCEDYMESIRTALKETNDKTFLGQVPYISRVLESWFRDTYFVIPTDSAANNDKAIQAAYENVYDAERYGHGDIYGTDAGKIKLSGTDMQLIEVDDEYKEQTDEYWTQYELNDDGTYRLYVLSTNGQYATDLNDSAITEGAKDKCEKDDKGFVYYKGTTKEAEEEGVVVVKKPITRTEEDWTAKASGDLLWSAYNYNSTASNEMVPLEVNEDSTEDIKNVSLTEYDTYEERIYYSLNSVRTVMQIEDGQRGITNYTIKKMFKHRKYYMYDGTAPRAEAIYEDWQNVISGKDEEEVEKAIDDLYYGTSTSIYSYTEDPRDPDLIGNIDINTDSLNAFSILENIHTLDADYAYRDFKELIVELNYFDKEDLSGKVSRVFSWIIPEMKTTWPIRFIDKSENYYGTYVHSNEALNNIKNKYGITEDESGNVQVTSDEISEEDAKTLSSAKGYEYKGETPEVAEGEDAVASLGEVISPVTGEVIGYGTHTRINTDLIKYEGASEEEATEEVGYIQIKVMDGAYFEESWVPGATDVGVEDENDSTKYSNAEALNAFYEEYEKLCEGYIVTIDGIDLLDGTVDIDSLKSLPTDSFKVTDSFKPNVTANLVDDEQEKKNQQKENAKAKAPAAVKNGDRLYIREGTIIGYTTKNDNLKGKDYSYIRTILRNNDRALRENVENYFDLFVTSVANNEGIYGELEEINDTSNQAEKIRAAVTYFKGQGFTTEAACGIVGNLMQESSLDPTANNGGHCGVAQWNTSYNTWQDINTWLSDNGYNSDSFAGQIRALVESDISKSQMSDDLWIELKSLNNIEKAAELFCVYYERCTGGTDASIYYKVGSKWQELNKRKTYAQNAYDIYMGNGS